MQFAVRTSAREQFVDVTLDVAEAVRKSGVVAGVAVVFSAHTTAGVTINENADPSVLSDLTEGLSRVAPRDAGWRHAEGNSDGHLKTSLVGPSVVVPVASGELVLGVWQGIYLAEFDGPRTRTVHVTVVPGIG